MRGVILSVVLLASAPAWAGPFKCNVQGRVSYQDTPCPSGREVDLGPNSRAPAVADRDAAERRGQADIAAVAAARQAEAQREAEARERHRAEAEAAAEKARQHQEACLAEKARLQARERRHSADWKARDAHLRRMKAHYRKCN